MGSLKSGGDIVVFHHQNNATHGSTPTYSDSFTTLAFLPTNLVSTVLRLLLSKFLLFLFEDLKQSDCKVTLK